MPAIGERSPSTIPPNPRPLRSYRARGLLVVALVVGLGLAFELVANLTVDILWFHKLGYLETFLTRFKAQVGLFAIAATLSAIFLEGNLQLANDFKWQDLVPRSSPKASPIPTGNYRSVRPKNLQFPMGLKFLLPFVLLLCIFIGLMLVHYSQVALQVWEPKFDLPSITPTLPSPFNLNAILTQIPDKAYKNGLLTSWSLVSIAGTILLLLASPRWCLRVFAIAMSAIFGFVLSGNWTRILLFFNEVAFNQTDPIYGRDIGFYLYQIPVLQLIYFWLGGLSLWGFTSCLLTYVVSGHSLSEGNFIGFSPRQLRHLSGLGSLAMAVQALHHWLARYELMYSSKGEVFGIGYTEYHLERRVELILLLLASAIAIWLFLKAIGTHPEKVFPKPQLRGIAALYVLSIVLGSFLLPGLVQRFIVQPNELARETQYLQHSIQATRAAFAIDEKNVEVETFNPQADLNLAKLANNRETVENIRLWDTRPILTTIRQLQQIRLYYRFPSADVDRYTMPLAAGGQNIKQQVIVAARELDYKQVPQAAQTWVNRHLVYTHGYGFTVSPVNKVGEGGLPDYFVQDIGTAEQGGLLRTANAAVRQTIPIENPRIYYGELTNNYIMTPSRVPELDFPSGNENAYTTYKGAGGVLLGSFWRKLIFAEHLKDWQMLFTQNFRPDTRVLLRRDINHRLRAIAPFLRYDLDPYLVSVNIDKPNPENPAQKNYLYWIIDAYTTSDHYPYSDPGKYPFNYTRNAVKVVLDAYNGHVDFYVAQPDEPLIQSWQRAFPQMFKPLEAMPASLKAHLRYPTDLLEVQSERLLAYHMIDPTVFYNREDQWQIPLEIYGAKQQPVRPYHLIMNLPTTSRATDEEFILLQPFTPVARPNLIAWLAARSDGENYGKLLLYQFPKQKLVYGIEQIQALMNQDPVISQLISLWDREGSKAIQGNLLAIPIENSLLYVEPLYLEADENGLPTLVRVIVAYDNRIAIAETLQQAFEKLFTPESSQPNQPGNGAIIRPLEQSDR
ncbi:UPF0182 family protein [Oscillatoria sp. FACHB-1406]|uniref:UPF0182 family protein n=1 Tax=Oscillatoria sp. FACHB-1406 TaxID=2692846 RepID=UPI001686FF77|nr:UPF0182 family protein [Oscillatoria sp. FACHB-1406]MBD2577430.1 UPF0182 family protein [Oscillatoria sp. FACHB-1406]